MDWQRTLLLGAMAAVTFMLFLKWNEFQERKRPAVEVTSTLPSTVTSNPVPDTPIASVEKQSSDIPISPEIKSRPQVTTEAQLITVKTNTLEVTIDTHGGDIVKVALPQHLATLENSDIPFELLNRTESHTYIAQSGLVGANGTDSAAKRPTFTAQQNNYQMPSGTDVLNVDLTLTQNQVELTKRFIFHRDDYLVEIEYLIDNQGDTPWRANLFAQIKRDGFKPPVDTGIGIKPFLGAATTTPDKKYNKFTFDDLDESTIETTIQGGWVAMVQHYFLSAWIPDQELENSFKLRKAGDKTHYLLGFTSPQTEVAAGSKGVIKASFYAGPKDIDRLEQISPYLDLTVDYGWLWWIAKPLFHFLNFIYSLLGNWGLSIIVLTIIVKGLFFPLSAASYRSMAKMRKVQPLMAELKERYGDNRQKMSEELMKLYRKEKVNPLGGCLPVLVQMPVFISLYWVLMESVELRHTPFLGWIDDLSVKDPIFVLPLIMGVTMWFQQKLNPTPADPTQARVMQLMPIVFTFMFLWFPAGLVLYWVVNNTLSIAQQYVITRQIEAADKK